MDEDRRTTSAIMVIGVFVTVVSLSLALYFFVHAIFSNVGNYGEGAPMLRLTTNLLISMSLAYLFAAASIGYATRFRAPIPFLVGAILLAVAQIMAVPTQAYSLRQSVRWFLPTWVVLLGIVCALFALAATWLQYRSGIVAATLIVFALAAAGATILLFTARSNALRDASGRVCPHLSSVIVGWIEPSLTIPDCRLRAARLQPSTPDPSPWFAVADLQGEGFEVDAEVDVWRVDPPGASTPLEFEYRAQRDRIDAVNALATSVNTFPAKPLAGRAPARLDSCTKGILREGSGVWGVETLANSRPLLAFNAAQEDSR